MPPPDNTRIRIEQLIALGWSHKGIAAKLGVRVQDVDVCRTAMDEINEESDAPLACGTHAAFTRHRLKNETPCTPCIGAEREYRATRRNHRRISEALDEDTVHAIHRLSDAGFSAQDIAVRLRVAPRTVTRYRTKGTAA